MHLLKHSFCHGFCVSVGVRVGADDFLLLLLSQQSIIHLHQSVDQLFWVFTALEIINSLLNPVIPCEITVCIGCGDMAETE